MVFVPNSTTKEVADEVLIIFISILMFFSIPNFPIFEKYFDAYPYVIFGIAIVLLIYRKKILAFFKVKS